MAAQPAPDKKAERDHGIAHAEPEVQQRAGGFMMMTLTGPGASQMGKGEHKGEKVFAMVVVQASQFLSTAQLCASAR